MSSCRVVNTRADRKGQRLVVNTYKGMLLLQFSWCPLDYWDGRKKKLQNRKKKLATFSNNMLESNYPYNKAQRSSENL